MGYMHIDNLYKNSTILMLRECWALEKIHGTSAHLSWYAGEPLRLHSGGEKFENFQAIFDIPAIEEAFKILGYDEVMVFGEAYGGKQQKQAWRYGPNLKFVAFEVKIGGHWLAVENASAVAKKLGLEFVHYQLVSTDVEVLNEVRDAPSVQSKRNGVVGDQPREGVVLRPTIELLTARGERVMAKHKRDEERETRKPRVVGEEPAVLVQARAIALEWVTDTRLEHVMDHLGGEHTFKRIPEVISAMIEDVTREGAGEIVDSKAARREISHRVVKLYKSKLGV